jgi:hypothetical protein
MHLLKYNNNNNNTTNGCYDIFQLGSKSISFQASRFDPSLLVGFLRGCYKHSDWVIRLQF